MVSEVHMNYPSIAASGKHFTTLWVMSAASLRWAESGCGGPDTRPLHIRYEFGTRSRRICFLFVFVFFL